MAKAAIDLIWTPADDAAVGTVCTTLLSPPEITTVGKAAVWLMREEMRIRDCARRGVMSPVYTLWTTIITEK